MNILSQIIFIFLLCALYPQVSFAGGLSRDIGCEKWPDGREHDICQSLSANLNWGWTGHATIAPSWRVTWATVKDVYCDLDMGQKDLPVLETMCGAKVHPYMSCIQPMDSRLATGVEYLIKTIHAQHEMNEEFVNTVYDPSNKDYLLKGGCKK